MPRKLRFERAGGLYHVLNRGHYRNWIFENLGAKLAFEKSLSETCERRGWIVHAYCVMMNHYHLALEAPEPNLSDVNGDLDRVEFKVRKHPHCHRLHGSLFRLLREKRFSLQGVLL